MTLIQAATIFGFALIVRRQQARRDRTAQLIRMHATGQITDAGLDRLRAAIHAHRDGPA